jgi:hypothetical protein
LCMSRRTACAISSARSQSGSSGSARRPARPGSARAAGRAGRSGRVAVQDHALAERQERRRRLTGGTAPAPPTAAAPGDLRIGVEEIELGVVGAVPGDAIGSDPARPRAVGRRAGSPRNRSRSRASVARALRSAGPRLIEEAPASAPWRELSAAARRGGRASSKARPARAARSKRPPRQPSARRRSSRVLPGR